MNKSTLQDALAMFERFEIDAELEGAGTDDTISVQTSNPDVYVQISKQEVLWRADQHLELLKQESEQPCDYSANFLRALVYWMDARPEDENDGKTVERIIEEFRKHQKTS